MLGTLGAYSLRSFAVKKNEKNMKDEKHGQHEKKRAFKIYFFGILVGSSVTDFRQTS